MNGIRVSKTQPFKSRAFSVTINFQQAVAKGIERMLKLGIFEPSLSTYINPIILVIMKSGGIRLYLDARKVPDYECNRNINELLKATTVNG